jgi:hypothetical protein
MATQRIAFTEWTPDLPGVAENLSVAKNVVPNSLGYNPFPLAVNYSASASENLNNVFAGRFSATTNVFAGGATKLFKFDSADLSMDNVSKAGNYVGITKWNFTQFGNTIIAANNVNKLQYYTLGSSATFDDLDAAAPIAEYVTVVRDFVVAASLDAGTNSNKVQWSDINDETNWTSGATSQSDYQIIADGGNIHGITGGEFGLIFLDRAIVRMSYIGSPLFFQFDTISRGVGCIEGNSVVQYGAMTYFLGSDGFYSCDGTTVTPIGTQKVDNWFYNNINLSKLSLMSSTIDPFRKIVVWSFIDNFAQQTLLIYNWQVQKWSYCTTDVDYVSSSATAGLTLEGLDIYGTLDTLTTSLDDALWAGGKFLFAGVRDDKIVTFTGANSSAQLTTGDIGSENTSVVTLARPVVDNGSGSVAIASRMLLNEVPELGLYTTASSENRVSLRSAGKYHRLSVIPSGDNWKNAIGIDIDVAPQGTR